MADLEQSMTVKAEDFKALVHSTYGIAQNADNVKLVAEDADGIETDVTAIHLTFKTQLKPKNRGGRRKKTVATPEATEPARSKR